MPVPDYTDSRLASLLAGGVEGSLIGLLCSRNARPRKGLVGRAQWETDSGYPHGGDTSELGVSIIMRILPLASPAGFEKFEGQVLE